MRMDDYVNPTADGVLNSISIVHPHHIQRNLWIIGNRDCMKCEEGNVLGFPRHCNGLELRYVILQRMTN